jgi:hypothetical protein
MKAPQQGTLFLLMGLHPMQDVVLRLNGLDDMRALVQHDTFGAHTHRRPFSILIILQHNIHGIFAFGE